MSNDKTREAFEAWWGHDGKNPEVLARYSFGDYEDELTYSAWDAWQAALSASEGAAPVAAGRMVITLCGSARFEALFKAWNEALTVCGHTVFSLTAYPSDKGRKDWYSDEVKRELDAAHLRKIAASDAIFVINRHAYIGESTMREIEYARQLGKAVYFLESWGKGLGIGGSHTNECRADCLRHGLSLPTASPIDTFTHHTNGNLSAWGGSLMGPAGPARNAAIELTKQAEAATTPHPAVKERDEARNACIELAHKVGALEARAAVNGAGLSEALVSRRVAQQAVNHASLGVPGSIAEATAMLDNAAHPAAPLSEGKDIAGRLASIAANLHCREPETVDALFEVIDTLRAPSPSPQPTDELTDAQIEACISRAENGHPYHSLSRGDGSVTHFARLFAKEVTKLYARPAQALPVAATRHDFESQRAQDLARAWAEGWSNHRDSDYSGSDAQNEAFNRSETLSACLAIEHAPTTPPAEARMVTIRHYNVDGTETVHQRIAARPAPAAEVEPVNHVQDILDQSDLGESFADHDTRPAAPLSDAASGIELAAKWVDDRRDKFAHDLGHIDPDTGSLEFGRGALARAREEYHGELVEIADGIRALAAMSATPGGGK